MLAINSVLVLLLLSFADRNHCATASGSYDAAPTVNIAIIVSSSDLRVQENASSSSSSSLAQGLSMQGPSNDFVLAGNTSASDTWLDVVADYATAANNNVLYQAASWVLLEDGAQHENVSTFWARFQTINSTAAPPLPSTVCAVVAEWKDSWSEDEAALAAVKIEDRLQDNCGENDTIALVFTSVVSNTVAGYLEGDVAFNDAVVPIPLQDVDSTTLLEASPTDDRVFVRLASNVCRRDAYTTSLSNAEILVISLLTGDYCAELSSSHASDHMPPNVPSEVSDSSNNSNWKDDLRFIIPVGIVIFLLGCAGLVYVVREKKKTPPIAKPQRMMSRTSSQVCLTFSPCIQ